MIVVSALFVGLMTRRLGCQLHVSPRFLVCGGTLELGIVLKDGRVGQDCS